MKKTILLITTILFVLIMAIIAMPSNVFAAIPDGISEEFKAILNENGEIVITDTSNVENNFELLLDVLEKHSTENYKFAVYSNNEDVTLCGIGKYDTETNAELEAYEIVVKYEEKYSEEFKKILDENGNFVITNTGCNGINELVYIQCNLVSTEEYNFSPFFFENWDGTTCTIQMYEIDENYNNTLVEQHVVNIVKDEQFGDEFKKLLNDGNKIVITSSTQGDKENLIREYCERFRTETLRFNVQYVNEDATKCVIEFHDDTRQYNTFVEQHLVTVSYEEKYSDEFKKVLNSEDGILITSSSLGEKLDLINDYVDQFSTDTLIYSCDETNEDGTVCTISISKANSNTGWRYIVEQHVVNVSYEEKISDEFKKALNENAKIIIKTSRDYGKEELLWNYCSAISDYFGIYFDVNDVNEDVTACTLKMCIDGESYNQIILEQHIVNIEYDKQMSDDFKNVLTDGKFVINSVKPTTEDEWWMLFEVLYMSLQEDAWFHSYDEEDLSAMDLTIIDSKGYPETHRVEVVFNYDENIKKIADELIKKIPEREQFEVKDLELVNYWLNGGKNETKDGVGKLDNYSSELKSLVENKNFNIIVDHRKGMDEEFATMRGGPGLLQYNGVTYGMRMDINILANHVLYVPDETASTKEALLAAVQKRVDEYAGEGKVKITAGEGTIFEYYKNYYAEMKKELEDKLAAEKAKENPNKALINDLEWEIEYVDSYYEYFLESYNNQEFGEHYFLQSAEGDYWFVATIDGEDYEFIVVKDSDSMITPTHKTADLSTNIEISSTATSIPLDTAIEAEKLISGEEYEKIIKILSVDNDETFDLKLYSNSLEQYITKLEDGTFEVRIPLPDKFKNKTDLKVYYVDENGKIQEYDVKVENGYAIFTTNHFSIYTLSEKVDFDVNKYNESIDAVGKDNQTGTEDSTNKGDKDITPDTGALYILNYVAIITLISALGIIVLRKRI